MRAPREPKRRAAVVQCAVVAALSMATATFPLLYSCLDFVTTSEIRKKEIKSVRNFEKRALRRQIRHPMKLVAECHGIADEGICRLQRRLLRHLQREHTWVIEAHLAWKGNISFYELANFPMLEVINGNRMYVNDDCWTMCGPCTRLRSVTIRNSSISGKGLSRFPTLQCVRLINCDVTDDALVELRQLHQLRVLEISEVLHGSTEDLITTKQMDNLLSATNLEELRIRDCTIGNLHSFRHCNRLRRLDLGHTTVDDEGLRELSGLTMLEELRLDGCNITSEGIAHLSNLKQLKLLSLAETGIDDDCVEILRELPALHSLNLWKTSMSRSSVDMLRRRNPGTNIPWIANPTIVANTVKQPKPTVVPKTPRTTCLQSILIRTQSIPPTSSTDRVYEACGTCVEATAVVLPQPFIPNWLLRCGTKTSVLTAEVIENKKK